MGDRDAFSCLAAVGVDSLSQAGCDRSLAPSACRGCDWGDVFRRFVVAGRWVGQHSGITKWFLNESGGCLDAGLCGWVAASLAASPDDHRGGRIGNRGFGFDWNDQCGFRADWGG